MKGYNKNRQKFNVQLSDGTNNISFEQMWALNQASKSPGFISNPLAKAYSNAFVSGGQVLQGIGGIASAVPIPGVAIGGAALSMLGGLIDKPAAQKPTYGAETTTRYGMATGGSMEPISPNAMEVTGAPNQTDGNQINYKGQPINVDHGEVIDHSKDIVFSDKLFDPRSGKSFADTVKPMEKLIGKLSKMPSNINNNTIKALEQQKQKVFQTQEQVAAALGQRNSDGSTVQPGQPAMASGGKIKSYVTGGDPGNPQKKYYNLFDRLFGTNTANKFNYIEKGPTRIANSPMSLLMQKNGITGPETTITAKRIKKANIQPPKSRDFSNSNYTSSTQSSKNYVTTGTNNFPTTSMMQQQNNVQTTPNTVTPKSSRNTVTPKSSRNTIPTRSTSIIPTGNEFQYPKGYEAASRLGLNPEDFYEDADQFLKTPAGKLWEQVQRAEDPNYKGFSKDKKFGKYHTAMYQNPEFQRIASGQVAKEQAAFSQANQKMKEYNPTAAISDLIKKVDKGNTEPINPLKPKLDYLPAIKQRFKPIPKFGVGDYMQLGAAGASVLGALLDRPEKQKPNLDKTQITQNRYDPANALMQNQYTTNAGMMANTNNYSSAGVQAGLQNLMANKYRADSQVQSQYDQMNQQARTQYEQRLQQQNQFNAQTLSANDDKNVANRAAYTNNLYGALQTVSQVGAGLNDKQAMDTYLKLLAQRDPQASAGILNADGKLVSEKKWSGGKIKLRKRR